MCTEMTKTGSYSSRTVKMEGRAMTVFIDRHTKTKGGNFLKKVELLSDHIHYDHDNTYMIPC